MLDFLALLICGFLFGFSLAFGIGANDAANTFGTTVGSGAITIIRAFALASVCETVGAVLLGGGVASAISKGVIDINAFAPEPDLLMLGYLSALIASTIWLITATLLKLPVSGTQSAVGAMVGVGVVVLGFDAVNWFEIFKISFSWVASPLLSGLISAIMFLGLKAIVFKQSHKVQLERAIMLLPFFYAITLSVNIFACLFGRPYFVPSSFEWSWYLPACSTAAVGAVSAIFVYFIYAPRLKCDILQQNHVINPVNDMPAEVLERWAANPVPSFPTMVKVIEDTKSIDDSNSTTSSSKSSNSLVNFLKNTTEWSGLDPLFWKLQIITSCFAAIAHGGNDVANAVAPITGMYEIYNTGKIPGEKSQPEIWILFYGGVGMIFGLWALGRNVIETIGGKLADISPPKGFVIELGTSLTVLAANQIGLPISTTFCKVGSIVVVGMCNGRNEVSWKLVFEVVMAWIFTVPATALLSAGVMAGLQTLFHNGDETISDQLIDKSIGANFTALSNMTTFLL